MLRKPSRPRETRVVELSRTTYTIAEFCEMTGLSRAVVLRSIDNGSLRAVKVGSRRLILAGQASGPVRGQRTGGDAAR
jgi:excisionase family DNA binding protein